VSRKHLGTGYSKGCEGRNPRKERKMEVFDLKTMEVYSLEEREKNVIYRSEDFSARIISLPPGGAIPPCEMAANVVFTVISGEATVEVDGEETALKEGCCLISGPATLSMRAVDGVRILGIQVSRKG